MITPEFFLKTSPEAFTSCLLIPEHSLQARGSEMRTRHWPGDLYTKGKFKDTLRVQKVPVVSLSSSEVCPIIAASVEDQSPLGAETKTAVFIMGAPHTEKRPQHIWVRWPGRGTATATLD